MQARDVTAQMIWDDLAANGASTSRQVRRRTGLSHMQFWYGLGYLKDVMQDANGLPLVWSPSYGVYSLTATQAEWEEYVTQFRMRSISTQARRLEETVKAGGTAYALTRTKDYRLLLAAVSSLRQIADAASR